MSHFLIRSWDSLSSRFSPSPFHSPRDIKSLAASFFGVTISYFKSQSCCCFPIYIFLFSLVSFPHPPNSFHERFSFFCFSFHRWGTLFFLLRGFHVFRLWKAFLTSPFDLLVKLISADGYNTLEPLSVKRLALKWKCPLSFILIFNRTVRVSVVVSVNFLHVFP